MRIKRLEVIGFKSFCDRTIVQFNEPITGVVGPNGCGKSNIVDAIRWCMGEQSAKHLRGKAMDDVIFAGSDSRGPLGMCEVTLVFENDGRVPVEYLAYSEIAVTRKLYRDGTSEYYLNKTPCRLRDITEFFLGTGVGAKAYSIIEQGRVGMIVSSKPEDRRFLIEEAAGITKYKLKKKAAEKKMDATRQNLLRVSDVVAEIEKQLGSLRRQAQKAERYREYKAELKDLELWTSSQKWLGLYAEDRLADGAQSELRDALGARHTELDAKEAALEALRLEATAEEDRLQSLQQQVYELDNRIRLGEAENEHDTREITDRSARAAAEREECTATRSEGVGEAERLAGVEAERAALAQITAGKAEELTAREADLRARKEALAKVQAEVEAARGEVSAKKTEIARGEQAEEAAIRRRDDLRERLGRLADEETRQATRGRELKVEIGELTERLEGLRQLRLGLVEEKGRSEARLAELKDLLAKESAELETLTTELHRRRSRRASLEEIQARYEGFERGTRAVMQQKDSRWGIRALVADVVSAPPVYEAAVEAVLGERLGAVLVETQEVGVGAIDYLREKNEGRASFVPVNRFEAAGQSERPSQLAEGVRGRLIDLVKFGEEYAGVAERWLSDVLVVEDLLTALDLWRSAEGDAKPTYVTLTGEVVDRNGVVTGGSEVPGAGVLMQKREIRELDELLAGLTERHTESTARHTQWKGELSAIQKTLEALQKNSHDGEIQILTLEKDLQRDREEEARIVARLTTLSAERLEMEGRAEGAARELEDGRELLMTARDRLVTLEDELSRLGHAQVGALEEVERSAEAVTSFRVEVAQVEEKTRALDEVRDRLIVDAQNRVARVIRLEESIAAGEARVTDLHTGVETRRAELLTLVEERGAAGDELARRRAAYEERRGRLAEEEGGCKTLRGEIERLSEQATEVELKLHDLRSARLHLEEVIAERYRIELASQVCDHHLRPVCGDREERRTKELRDLIDRMGEINLNAIEEYNELETRHTFLSGQKADLEQALGQLEEAIARINRTSKQRFREVFDLVNQKFQEIFPRCFRGGQARLILTDEENLLESGIEIIAQPPGKKNSTVEVLSGGEKAMTAVALIFAIFLIKPSPFCLLDEVDAPLDEANVGRFNDLIREMTDRSQFIVITHNKRTMQIADTLYGVTMEEPGISKLVAVNLGQIGKDGKDAPGKARRIAAA
jgi:chromosome segregation protein